MWRESKCVPETTARGVKPSFARNEVHLAREEDPVCCGQAMEPRLARARDRMGQIVYMTVWHCSCCSRDCY